GMLTQLYVGQCTALAPARRNPLICKRKASRGIMLGSGLPEGWQQLQDPSRFPLGTQRLTDRYGQGWKARGNPPPVPVTVPIKDIRNAQDQDQPGGGQAFPQDRLRQVQGRPRQP